MEVTFKNSRTPLSEVIRLKDRLSEFVVVDSKMNEVNSQDLKGMKLYLTVPSVDTRICSIELSKFIEYLKDEDVVIVSISMDLPFALERWCHANKSEKMMITSDFRYHDFADASGLLMLQIGLFARSVILVDANNIVRYIEIMENVSDEPNYQEAINQIRKRKK